MTSENMRFIEKTKQIDNLEEIVKAYDALEDWKSKGFATAFARSRADGDDVVVDMFWSNYWLRKAYITARLEPILIKLAFEAVRAGDLDDWFVEDINGVYGGDKVYRLLYSLNEYAPERFQKSAAFCTVYEMCFGPLPTRKAA